MKRATLVLFILIFAGTAFSPASGGEAIRPQPGDRCPVCGMFVAKYTEWISEIVFEDGSYAVFDGAKDMFRYYRDLKKYNPSKSVSEIADVFVTDYYSVKFIDARKAYFVIGSDVLGPMGKELVAFGKRQEAEVFLKDHQGRDILTFDEISDEVLESLK